MARPPMPLGTFGNIRVYRVASGGYRAVTTFRDYDGVTRPVERHRATERAAEKALKEHLRDRTRAGGTDGLTGESKVSAAADLWLVSIDAAAAAGQRSPSTAQLYRGTLDRQVRPALGAVRLREVTVPRLDLFVQTVRGRSGVATAKVARTVLSGLLGLAVRHGAIASNPARDIGRIEGLRAKAPRALSLEERREWLAQLDGDPTAVRKDLPDLCRWMLATGVRIGEALAVSWDEVDLDAATVSVEYTLIRIKGIGLVRKSTKTSAGERLLPLPAFAVQMLRRHRESEGENYPVFPDSQGGWRDPSNTSRDLRYARGSDGFAWVTSHVFRKTCATILDEAGLSARVIADQLGHSRTSMTQDAYLGRRLASDMTARVLDRSDLGGTDDAFPEG